MKIERKEEKLVKFKDLNIGDVFECSGGIIIKILDINGKFGVSVNCVNLEYGTYGLFNINTLVKPYPNAKVVLED